ncbi:hypothetical protein OOT46_25155 [Aquabacterium sp. A7-Y]|nr:hypothetical protein [Aquabacterium sp. A7-Y]MCW7541107.1 hypothetical protein [Aquabacterium sp. A7-Y]
MLDPEQNVPFRDTDIVPGPMRDRMEVIELPGYTLEQAAHRVRGVKA